VSTPLSTADYQSLAEFRFAIRRFTEFSQTAVSEAGITPQQHQVLLGIKALGLTGPVVIRSLAEWLRLQHHSVIGLIDRLERRGLVRRGRSASDRRYVVLRLTRAGEVLLSDLSQAHRRELRAAAPMLVSALSTLVANR
jgi:DNA-binding MarR family transcriptional regulator